MTLIVKDNQENLYRLNCIVFSKARLAERLTKELPSWEVVYWSVEIDAGCEYLRRDELSYEDILEESKEPSGLPFTIKQIKKLPNYIHELAGV